MNLNCQLQPLTLAVALALIPLAGGATEPCGDFGECKVLIEINATDGDIGFHFLMDGDELRGAALLNPKHKRIFHYKVRRELREQTLTEIFAESAEPLCFDPTLDDDPENDDEDFVTLEDFIARWTPGTYRFVGVDENFERSFGASELTFNLPAAPTDLEFELEADDESFEGSISWAPGDDLGECSDGMALLPTPPADVPIAAWEVVFEPEVDGRESFPYVVRIPGDVEELEVEVPDDYLESLPPNTPAKIEVGAIGFDDNATFSEEGEICVNKTRKNGCGFEDED